MAAILEVRQKLDLLQESINSFDQKYDHHLEQLDGKVVKYLEDLQELEVKGATDDSFSPPSLHQSMILTWLATRFPSLWVYLVREFSEHIDFSNLNYDNIRSVYNYIEDFDNVESDPIIRSLIEKFALRYNVSPDHYSQVLRVALQAYSVLDLQKVPAMSDFIKSSYHDTIYSPMPIDRGYLSTMAQNWVISLLDIIAAIQISEEF
eukprot:NODE_324_length_9702_cov_1.027491.p5 type:complete len:206 gc:universal NODE_324_length_9702_cov_1.027491:6970-6353(-)